MLRYYHEIGVLEPASVDPDTGYRRYSREQAARARLIARLRSVEVTAAWRRSVTVLCRCRDEGGGDGSGHADTDGAGCGCGVWAARRGVGGGAERLCGSEGAGEEASVWPARGRGGAGGV